MVISTLMHVVIGVVLLAVYWQSGRDSPMRSLVEQPIVIPEDREEELTLGSNDATTASINWLGIMRDEAVEGEAEISEVEQAAQTTVVGESADIVEEAVEQPLEEVIEEPTEMVERVAQEEFEREEILAAVEEMTKDVADAVGEMVGQAVEGIDALMEGAASDVVIPERVEGGGGAPLVEEQPDPMTEATAPARVVKESAEGVVGMVGVLSEREVTATRIKKAIDVDPRTPNAPIIGKGLEILTMRPRYSSAVRVSGISKNPVVLMWFDSTGKVSKAEFVRDGKVVYSSGVVGVDEPLLNAVYQWRAKGTQIDDLDPKDPADLVEVTIKFMFRRERPGSTD